MINVNIVQVISLMLFLSDTVVCSRYDYLLFENFELMKKSFVKEQQLVKNLHKIRHEMYQLMSALNSNINDNFKPDDYGNADMKTVETSENDIYFRLKDISKSNSYRNIFLQNAENMKYPYIQQKFNDIFDYENSYQFKTKDILNSALKGVIMLQETYNQDIKEYSKGTLRFKSVIERNSRNIDSLQPDDLASMSTLAFDHLHWYDNALKYLKASIDMFYSFSKEKRDELPRNLETSLLMMKKQYPVFHNDMLNKKTNIIGPDWKLYSNFANTGL